MPDRFVRPPRPTQTVAAVLEHVAAVERAGLRDPRDPVAEAGQRLLGAGGLGLALVGARPADHREVAVAPRRCPRRRPRPGSRRRAAPRRSPSPRPASAATYPSHWRLARSGSTGDAGDVGEQPVGEARARGGGPGHESCDRSCQPSSGETSRATTLGGRVSRSSASASVIARSPALMPSQRSGSGSHDRERWPTHGSRVSSVSRPRTRSRRVRPARLVVLTPSPTYPPAQPSPVVAVQPDRGAPVARDAERAAPRVGDPGAREHREQVDQGLAQLGEDPVVAVVAGPDPRAEVVRRPAAAEHQPVVGGALAVDDQVPVVGERLASAQPDLRPRSSPAAARWR